MCFDGYFSFDFHFADPYLLFYYSLHPLCLAGLFWVSPLIKHDQNSNVVFLTVQIVIAPPPTASVTVVNNMAGMIQLHQCLL